MGLHNTYSSTMFSNKQFGEAIGRIFFVCFKNPMAHKKNYLKYTINQSHYERDSTGAFVSVTARDGKYIVFSQTQNIFPKAEQKSINSQRLLCQLRSNNDN